MLFRQPRPICALKRAEHFRQTYVIQVIFLLHLLECDVYVFVWSAFDWAVDVVCGLEVLAEGVDVSEGGGCGAFEAGVDHLSHGVTPVLISIPCPSRQSSQVSRSAMHSPVWHQSHVQPRPPFSTMQTQSPASFVMLPPLLWGVLGGFVEMGVVVVACWDFGFGKEDEIEHLGRKHPPRLPSIPHPQPLLV